MNELRMYVEGLFEGKVLTADAIELKEEIYGNLLARYDDLIAEGVDEEDALRRTKESITSIDDMLNGDQVPDAPKEEQGAGSAPSERTQVISAAGEGPTAPDGCPTPSSADGAPVRPSVEDAQASSSRRRKIWPYVVGGCAVVLVLFGISAFGLGFLSHTMQGDGTAYRNAPRETPKTSPSPTPRDGATSDPQAGAAGPGSSGAPCMGGDCIRIDGNGMVWEGDDPADELLTSVVAARPEDIAPYANANLGDAGAMEGLLRALPMGRYATDVDVTLGQGVLGLAYRGIPDAYEGDSVDAALVYNVAAVFCAVPSANEIRVTVAEADDPYEGEYYVFTRDDAQRRFGVTLSDALMNEAGWKQLKEDNLYKGVFREGMVEAAEHRWR